MAATVKNYMRKLIRAAKEAAKDKTLPKSFHDAMDALRKSLGKTWTDLEAEAGEDVDEAAPFESDELPLTEAATVGIWCESRIHSMFTQMADDLYGQGYLTRDERKALSAGIGAGLDAFTASVIANAPQLYDRSPWQEPEAPAMMSEAEYQLDFVPLLEKAVRADGTMPVKIIQPGWGSSGYYSPLVLERAALSKVFGSGLKMYWNHPTMTEEAERPERDLRDLAAELVSDARWVPEHPSGPGLYADAKVFNPFIEAVDQLAPHIGVSIRALGKAETGQAEGKNGPIIKEISSARSVDFVTEPGAGGQILSLFEARRGAAHQPLAEGGINPQGEKTMGEKELLEANAQLQKQIDELKANGARLQEAELLREAEKIAIGKLAKADLPIVTRARLAAQLTQHAPIQSGKLDAAAFDALITEAVKTEMAYLVEVTGGGQITGMGSTQEIEPKPEEVTASLKESFERLGLSGKVAEIAAKGRN